MFTMSPGLLRSLAVIGGLFGAQAAGAASAPVIASIVSAASFEADYLGSGGLATIFGTNLKGDDSQQQCAGTVSPVGNTVAFGTTLCDTQVLQNGQAVPIIYVGRNPTTGQDQINFQLLHGAGTYQFQVQRTTDGQISATTSLEVLAAAPDVFRWSSDSGVNYPAALFYPDYSTVAPNNAATPTNPSATSARNIIQIFITGGGEPTDGTVIPPGQAAPTNRLIPIPQTIVYLQDLQNSNMWLAQPAGNVLFAGLAPGEIIEQVNWSVPTGTVPGARYFKICTSTGVCSNPVTLPVTGTGNYVSGNVQTLEQGVSSVTGNATQPDGTLAPLVVNASGNFLGDVAKGANQIALLGNGVFYNWRDTVSVTGPTLVGTVQMFPVYADDTSNWTYNPSITIDTSPTADRPELQVWKPGTTAMDLLDALNWMNTYYVARGGCHADTTLRILDYDLPRSVYLSPSDATPDHMAALSAAYADLNTRVRAAAGIGTDLLQLTTTTPDPNAHFYTVHFQSPPNSAYIAEYVPGSAGIPCTTFFGGDFYFGSGVTGSVNALQLSAGLGAGHAIAFGYGGFHLPEPKDLMYYAPGGTTIVFTTFEMKAITVLYWLKAGTDLAKYDNLPK